MEKKIENLTATKRFQKSFDLQTAESIYHVYQKPYTNNSKFEASTLGLATSSSASQATSSSASQATSSSASQATSSSAAVEPQASQAVSDFNYQNNIYFNLEGHVSKLIFSSNFKIYI